MRNVGGRGRRDRLRRVRRRSSEGPAGALDKSKRRTVFWRSQRDGVEAGGGEFGDWARLRARQDQRERAGPEGAREVESKRREFGELDRHREVAHVADEGVEGGPALGCED